MVVTMTRKEYEARFGVAPVISTPDPELAPVPRSMTRAEYNAEFRPEAPKEDGFFTKVGNAINEVNPFYQIPKLAIEGAQKLGTGLGEVLDSKTPGEIIQPTASALAGGTQMALAVPFGLFESVTNLPGLKQVKNFLLNPEEGGGSLPDWAGDKISEWKKLQEFVAQNPNSPEIVSDIATVALGLAAGGKVKSPEVRNNMIYVKSRIVGEPSTGGVGGTGILGIEGRSVANRNTKVTTEIATDLVNVKNGVARKTITPEIQARDMASATRLAETDALSGMVNSNGSIDPLLINDAIARYRYLREGDIDRSLVKNRLVEESKATNNATATNVGELTAALTEAAERFTGSFRDKLDGAIASEIRGLVKKADETGNIKLEDIHQAKIDNSLAASKDYGKLSSDAIEWRKAKANAYKTIVERNSKVEVKVDGKSYKIADINKELSKTEQDIAFLRSLAGRKVEGGRLGKHFASISGNLIGYAAGSMFGPIGGAIGTAMGGELARGMKGQQFKSTFGKDRGLPVNKNRVLQEANKPQTQDILRVPDKKVRSVQTVKKTPEIIKVEAQISRNVEAQKKAIKAGDFTLVAQLKEIYKNLVQHLKNLIKKIKETPNKKGGFVKNPLNQSSKSEGNLNQQYKANKTATNTANISKNTNTSVVKTQEKFHIQGKDGKMLGSIPRTKVQTIDTKLIKTGEDFQNALGDINIGEKSKTNLPVLAKKNTDGTFEILDGNHRVAQAMRKGKTEIEIMTDEKLYRELAEKQENLAPVYKGEKDLTTKILKDLEGKTTVSKQYILDATNRGELKQVERDLVRNMLDGEKDVVNVSDFAKKVKAELLPLKRISSQEKNVKTGMRTGDRGDTLPLYENVVLPDELRGSVKNYSESIYNSPIKTSAGSTHFKQAKGSDNYFGHTRIEDMADNKTRRVIEVQSDLYQKGNLEREMVNDSVGKPAKIGEIVLKYSDRMAQRAKEASKLQQYNDPTAHFRMIREEIKKAAQDGKTKLQFPTGETAMKIEGLGQSENNFRLLYDDIETPGGMRPSGSSKLTPEKLEVGARISSGPNFTIYNPENDWIITDVLGDGKFKAVPKQRYEQLKGLTPETFAKGGVEQSYFDRQIKAQMQSASEEFDISGKVDTNNPIYKFYEKDVQKYLNKFDGKRVKDEQGVEWIEVLIKKEWGRMPIEAFVLLFGLGLAQDN